MAGNVPLQARAVEPRAVTGAHVGEQAFEGALATQHLEAHVPACTCRKCHVSKATNRSELQCCHPAMLNKGCILKAYQSSNVKSAITAGLHRHFATTASILLPKHALCPACVNIMPCTGIPDTVASSRTASQSQLLTAPTTKGPMLGSRMTGSASAEAAQEQRMT